MSTSYRGTRWLRKRDNAVIRIEGDADAGGGYSNRSLRAVNEGTGRAFWVTPEGLHRKYERIWEDAALVEHPEENKVQSLHVQRVVAANEALKLLRKRHYPVQYVNRQRCCVSCFDASGKPHLWPCPDAELIYPTEELT
mgnify:CR=1 FL=1